MFEACSLHIRMGAELLKVSSNPAYVRKSGMSLTDSAALLISIILSSLCFFANDEC
jgi:hypothetical protein